MAHACFTVCTSTLLNYHSTNKKKKKKKNY